MTPRTIGVLIVLALAGCTQPQPVASPDADFITVTTQPANVGDAKIAALAYHDSGAYDRDLAIVADQGQGVDRQPRRLRQAARPGARRG